MPSRGMKWRRCVSSAATMSDSRPGCPGVAACLARRQACGHAARVATYRDWRTAWELDREASNPGMYDSELADWQAANPAPTFGAFLVQTAQRA